MEAQGSSIPREILSAMRKKISRRQYVIEIFYELWRRSASLPGNNARNLRNGMAILFDRFQQSGDYRLAFTFDDTINRAITVLEEFFRDKGRAVPSHEDETIRQPERGEFT